MIAVRALPITRLALKWRKVPGNRVHGSDWPCIGFEDTELEDVWHCNRPSGLPYRLVHAAVQVLMAVVAPRLHNQSGRPSRVRLPCRETRERERHSNYRVTNIQTRSRSADLTIRDNAGFALALAC